MARLWHWATSGLRSVGQTTTSGSEYQQLGELGYMEKNDTRRSTFINSHPRLVRVDRRCGARFICGQDSGASSARYWQQEPLDPPNIVLCTILTVLALVGLWRAFRLDASIAVLFTHRVIHSFLWSITSRSPEDYYRRPIDPHVSWFWRPLCVPARKLRKQARRAKRGRDGRST